MAAPLSGPEIFGHLLRFWSHSLPAKTVLPPSISPFVPLLTLFTLTLLLYLHLQLLLSFCSSRHAHGTLARVRSRYACVSTMVGLFTYVSEIALGLGGIKALLATSGASRRVGARLVASWAVGTHLIALESLLTLLACTPFALRLTCLLLPCLRSHIYPPAVKADAPPTQRSFSLGGAAEALRQLDASDALLTRLLIASLLWCLARYGQSIASA